ncbi:hypothetical protein LQZ18_13155 [Lachnospiraceae bacterium ZAX-1]
MLKECLKQGMLPFIIRDVNKSEYYLALNKAQKEQEFSKLTNYFKKEQAKYYQALQKYLELYE